MINLINSSVYVTNLNWLTAPFTYMYINAYIYCMSMLLCFVFFHLQRTQKFSGGCKNFAKEHNVFLWNAKVLWAMLICINCYFLILAGVYIYVLSIYPSKVLIIIDVIIKFLMLVIVQFKAQNIDSWFCMRSTESTEYDE